ncbi:response regulator [Paenibacillus sp. J5C_2022]|uniref:response regulator n=1 Tax=Paenibacillus sp. J5C2022 TaxID=2977129 RepID=UPI0021CFA344|nr:response regulator [Paenibacillus sp. J5C2022]MCU6707425.1 response regulator [Paenibacillus sp. J5C2022]
MYSVLIVDDEDKIRRGLKAIVNWSELGFTVIGDMSHGQEALQWMHDNGVPDVILTDIRMPLMDGLAFMQAVREEWRDKHIPFIVLSGYDYFEYAKKAIELGAFDYLLKPTKLPELQQKLGSLRQKLDRQRDVEKLVSEQQQVQREKGLRLVLEGKSDIEHDYEPVKHSLFEPGVVSYSVMVAEVLSDQHAETLQAMAREMVTMARGRMSCCELVDSDSRIIWLFGCHSEKSSEELLRHYAAEWMNKRRAGFAGVNIGIGLTVSGLSQTRNSYEEAKSALAQCFYSGPYSVRNFDAAIHEEPPLIYPLHKENELDDLIKKGDRQAMLLAVNEMLHKELPGKPPYQPRQLIELLTRLAWSLELRVSRRTSSQHHESVGLEISSREYPRFVDYSTLQTWFRDRMMKLMDWQAAASDEGDTAPGRIVKHMIDVVARKYHDPITLYTIADSLQMNAEYLSRLFKRETGQSFIQYLTAYRIEKAKLLLRDVSCKSYEVGYRVGYHNPGYFAKTFKKVTGLSVTDYREAEL